MKTFLSNLIPKKMLAPLLTLLGFQLLVFSGTKFLLGNLHHYNFENAFDLWVPFLPWTVVIYVGAFPFWVVSAILIARGDRDNAYRFFAADILCKAVSLVIFLALPTTNTRPEFEVTNLWEWGMAVVYWVDSAENLFPSFHCLLSWLLCRGMTNERSIPKGYKVFSYIFTVFVCISTMTTKQHILIDVISGVAMAEFFYQLCRSRKVTRFYYKLFPG